MKYFFLFFLIFITACSSYKSWNSDAQCYIQLNDVYNKLSEKYGENVFDLSIEQEIQSGFLPIESLDCVTKDSQQGVCKKLVFDKQYFWSCVAVDKKVIVKLEIINLGAKTKIIVTDTSPKKNDLFIDKQLIPLTPISSIRAEATITLQDEKICEDKPQGVQYPSGPLTRYPNNFFFCPPKDGESLLTYKDQVILLEFFKKEPVKIPFCTISVNSGNTLYVKVKFSDEITYDFDFEKNKCIVDQKGKVFSLLLNPPKLAEQELNKDQCYGVLAGNIESVGFEMKKTNCPLGCDDVTGLCKTKYEEWCCVVELAGGRTSSVIASGPEDKYCTGKIKKSTTGSCEEFIH
ncbi:hypothetical protein HYV79_02860 [Candidatus Woesearchaeota archaeon]|nr:hypothetical protein [Candidatus Woesearchaeota archaeon]